MSTTRLVRSCNLRIVNNYYIGYLPLTLKNIKKRTLNIYKYQKGTIFSSTNIRKECVDQFAPTMIHDFMSSNQRQQMNQIGRPPTKQPIFKITINKRIKICRSICTEVVTFSLKHDTICFFYFRTLLLLWHCSSSTRPRY